MDKRAIRSWIAFDWASQPFHTVIVTFVFMPFFVTNIVGDAVVGQQYASIMGTISALMVAIIAPISSAISDQGGGRKKWIFGFSVLFVLSCFGLLSHNIGTLMVMYILAYFAVEILLVFTNAYLPELVPKEEVGRLSGIAWGLGYAGGLVVLIIFFVWLMPVPDTDKTPFGLTPLLPNNFGHMSGPISGIWYVVFMIPFFLFIKDTPIQKSFSTSFRDGMSSLKLAFVKAWNDRQLFWFFLSSMVYRDALAGLFTFGSIYAAAVLGWSIMGLVAFGIILNITGIFGGVIGGWLDKKRSPYLVVRLSIWGFLLISFAALSTNTTSVIFVGVAEGSQLPHIVFFICGMLIGFFTGSLQGASRGMVVTTVGDKMKSGEAFGLYGMTGRATTFIAPLLVLLFTTIFQDVQKGAWPLVGLFLISIILFHRFEKLSR